MSELVDEHDLGSCAARRGGSSPPFPTFPGDSRLLTSYISRDRVNPKEVECIDNVNVHFFPVVILCVVYISVGHVEMCLAGYEVEHEGF